MIPLKSVLCLLWVSLLWGEAAWTAPQETNSLGMPLIRVSAGNYVRGFDSSAGGTGKFKLDHLYSTPQIHKTESPAHHVEISRDYLLGAREVTVGEFKKFVEAAKYVTDAEKGKGALRFVPEEKNFVDRFQTDPTTTWKNPGFEQTDQHPAVCVSWKDAMAFCVWLSKKEDVRYRLPTEAEWEYACRAGTTTWYSYGTNPDDAYKHGNVADGALEAAHENTTRYQRGVKLGKADGDGVIYTAAVARFEPNSWGFYDCHGNVWEWCSDRYAEDSYDRLVRDLPRTERMKVVFTDPTGVETTEQHEYGDWRVIRGGSWFTAPAYTRSSIRTFAEASEAACYTGFRVLRETK